MAQKQCSICGNSFESLHGSKYCSPECSKEGQRRTRKEWEERSGYLEKKRQWTKDYRSNQAEVNKGIIEKVDKKRAAAQKRQDTIRRKKAQKRLEEAAANGDIDAQMDLALDRDDMRTYYTLYRESIIKNDDEFNVKNRYGRHIIAGADVYDPDFVEKAVAMEDYYDSKDE